MKHLATGSSDLGPTSSRMVELVYGRLNDEAYARADALLPAPALPP